MREIKFKVWDERSKKMRKVFAIDFEDYTQIHAESLGDSDGDSLVLAHSYALLQYTGFKDKNGAEIYEGDILRTPYWRPYKVGGSLIEWRNFYYHVCEYDPLDEAKVIGNIYENPELLPGHKSDATHA